MILFRILIILGVSFLAFAAATSAPIDRPLYTPIDSVTEIKHAFGPSTVLVCDADETIGQVDCMPCNYENGRQHKEAMKQ